MFRWLSLAQKGEAGRALGMATVSSTVGGIFSVIVLVFFAPLLSKTWLMNLVNQNILP